MNPRLKKLFKTPMSEWTADDNKFYEEATKKKYTLKDLTEIAQEDWTAKEQAALDELSGLKLPDNCVILPKDESMVSLGSSAVPYTYTVQAGDTLKSIAEKFNISYGELLNKLINTSGDSIIKNGMDIVIPRYFIDTSKA